MAESNGAAFTFPRWVHSIYEKNIEHTNQCYHQHGVLDKSMSIPANDNGSA